MTDFSKGVALAATAVGLVLTTPAFAQDASVAGDAGDIVVTARRVEERLQDVPISITVFNQEQLAQRNIVNSTDLATYTPSLAVNQRYGADKASFSIRGFTQDPNTATTVAVYFADVVAPRLQSSIGGGNGAGVGSMFDLQNVQVLKGPQGTLFGRNTTGGAILLVPQKPTDRLEGYVEGTIGNYDEKRVQAVINLPLADTFKVRLGVDRNERDGFIKNRSGIGPDNFSDVNYTAARLSIEANLTPDLENYTVATYSRSNTNGYVGKFVYCTAAAALANRPVCQQIQRASALGYGYYDVENSVANPFVKSTTWQIINTTTWKASDTLTVKNIVSYGEAREKYSFNLDGDNVPIPFVVTYPGPHRGEGSQSTVTEEFQLQGGGDRLTWQAGGYMERSAPIGSQEQYTQLLANCTNPYTFQCTPGTGGNMGVKRDNYRYHTYAAYAQATYKFTDQLSLTAGIRETWDYTRVDADNIRVLVSPAGPTAYSCARVTLPAASQNADLLVNGLCTRSFVSESKRPTWLLDVDYKPTENLMVYARYARGYRAGGVNEGNVGLERWQPEKVDDYELGVKTSFHGAVSGAFNLTGFWNEFSNQQTQVQISGCTLATNPACHVGNVGISGIQNIGKSRMRGIEADGSLSFGAFRLDAGYAFLDAKVVAASVPFCDSTQYDCAHAVFLLPGSRLTFSPKNRLTVTGTYTLPVDEKIGRISLGATFTHTDHQFTFHSDDAAFALGQIPYNAGIMPATNLLNLNFDWKDVGGTPIDFSLFATNVTNQKYWVSITSSITSLAAESVLTGEPRMFGARLKYKFGQ
jgi:iron complex outermembrane receptor protein